MANVPIIDWWKDGGSNPSPIEILTRIYDSKFTLLLRSLRPERQGRSVKTDRLPVRRR